MSPETDLKPGDLRQRLIKYAQNPKSLELEVERVTSRTESHFETLVAGALVRNGYQVTPQYQVGGYRIDLVVSGAGHSRVAVECDGEAWHTAENLADDLEREAQISRQGWRFIRIRGSEYYRDPDATIARVCARLEELGVEPGGEEPEDAGRQSSELLERLLADATRIRAEWSEGAETWPEQPPGRLVREPVGVPPDSEAEEEHTQRVGTPSVSDLGGTQLAAQSQPVSDTVVQQAAQSQSDLELEAYEAWNCPGPLRDPFQTPRHELVDKLVEIVSIEGPVVARRAYSLLNSCAGNSRLGRRIHHSLNMASLEAVRMGKLVESNPLQLDGRIDLVLRLPGTPAVVLRERGPRDLREVPPDELSVVLQTLGEKRKLLELYGLKRLTPETDSYLDRCLESR